ncbi:MAG: phosphotransferase, partial [Alphaproteobacteria bacterium]
MTERDARIEAFLAGAGWRETRRAPLAGDASFRRYERVRRGDRRAVLMDAPPEHEDVRPFVEIARFLLSLGLSAPEILAADEAAGLLLLEDLGDDLYTRVLRDGADEDALYAVAVDVLTVLHDRPCALAVPAYDAAHLLAAAELFLDWFLPAMSGRPAPDDVRAAYHAAWSEVLPLAAATPQRLILRDYHADNLLWLP